jgi:hypothetical protein
MGNGFTIGCAPAPGPKRPSRASKERRDEYRFNGRDRETDLPSGGAPDRAHPPARTDAGDQLPRRGRASPREEGARDPWPSCLAFGAPVPRARIAAMLWDRVSAAQARTSFCQALSELIGAMGPLAAELISTGRATVRLNTTVCWVDALALLESSSSHASRTDLAVLCEGELLEGFDEVSATFGPWLARERAKRIAGRRPATNESIGLRSEPGFRHRPSLDLLRSDAPRRLASADARLGKTG